MYKPPLAFSRCPRLSGLDWNSIYSPITNPTFGMNQAKYCLFTGSVQSTDYLFLHTARFFKIYIFKEKYEKENEFQSKTKGQLNSE